MIEAWIVFALLQSGPGGLQASSQQLCEGNCQENKGVLESVELMESGREGPSGQLSAIV